MKKVITLLLAFFYLFTAAGINVSLHYCGGKLKSVSLLKITDSDYCCCNKTKKEDCCKRKICCKEKTIIVKVKDNSHITSFLTIPDSKKIELFTIALPQATLNFSHIFCSEIITYYHAPPDLYQTPIYLQNRILII